MFTRWSRQNVVVAAVDGAPDAEKALRDEKNAFAASAAQAQTKWDMPTPYSDGEFHTQNVRLFVEEVKKATNRAVDFEYYPAEQLGKAKDLLTLTQIGNRRFAFILCDPEGDAAA